MNIRRITSLTALLAFIILLFTSIVLYITPQGRVAYWSDWRFLTLTKTEWGNLHVNFGVLFLLSGFLHIYYNWQPIVAYLKNREKRLVIATREFNAALVITLLFLFGTYLMLPPFSGILAVSEKIKDAGALKYGEPPYGHAELSSLDSLIKKAGLESGPSLEALKAAGIRFSDSKAVFLSIAKENGMTPQSLFDIMASAGLPPKTAEMPELPPPGTGNKTLARICEEFGLDLHALSRILTQKGYRIEAEKTLKALADDNQVSPAGFYGIVRSAARPEEPS